MFRFKCIHWLIVRVHNRMVIWFRVRVIVVIFTVMSTMRNIPMSLDSMRMVHSLGSVFYTM